MTMRLCPETYPVIQGHEPVAANALADTSDWISLKNADGVLITVMHYSGGGDTDLVLTVHEGTTGAGTTAIAAGAEFPIWLNTDTSASDAMVRQTDAVTVTIDTGAGKDQIAQLYVPASVLTPGYSWVQLGASGGNAANIVSVLYQLDGARYQQTTPPTAIA